MVKSKDVPNTGKQGEIMDLVTNELIPGLEQERDYAKAEVASGLQQFADCNTQSSKGQETQATFGAGPVNDDRKNHSDCRGREEENHNTRKDKCGELDTFLATVNAAPEIPAGRSRRAMVQYVKSLSTEFCPMEPQTGDMDEACKKAIKEHEGEKVKCDDAQKTFESGFCQWRAMLIWTCEEADRCYKAATDRYEIIKADTTKLVIRLKTEYSALKKIECYLNVWLNDQNHDTADQAQYDKCNGADVDDSPMEVPMADAPPQEQCPVTSVEVYPGSATFSDKEYKDFLDYAITPLTCKDVAAVVPSS
jgi:hypothetical protein